MQILMSVPSTLMAVLMTASIPLHPMCVVVGLDICWLLMSDLVKVIVVKKLIYPGFGHLCALFFFQIYINECNLNTDGCAHICTNTIGSYVCS